VNLEHVFAKAMTVADDAGYPVTVQGGSHWLADDPLVLARPDLFTEDCRYGLSWSGEPPGCLSVPPEDEGPQFADDESSAAMTSRVRSRSRAASR
jgi:hypothetical protein